MCDPHLHKVSATYVRVHVQIAVPQRAHVVARMGSIVTVAHVVAPVLPAERSTHTSLYATITIMGAFASLVRAAC